jgi:hypothetical protein
MGLWNLFIVALMPVLNVLLITAVGVFLAIQRVDILGADARKHLNNVSNNMLAAYGLRTDREYDLQTSFLEIYKYILLVKITTTSTTTT